MSTNYYKLKYPITSIRIDENPVHVKISLWIDHGLSGVITIPAKRKREILDMIFDMDNPVIRTYLGGQNRGTVVTVFNNRLSDDAHIISEYREISTVGEVKKLGKSREKKHADKAI